MRKEIAESRKDFPQRKDHPGPKAGNLSNQTKPNKKAEIPRGSREEFRGDHWRVLKKSCDCDSDGGRSEGKTAAIGGDDGQGKGESADD